MAQIVDISGADEKKIVETNPSYTQITYVGSIATIKLWEKWY